MLSHLVGVKVPKIVFLMETKQSVEEMRNIKEDLQYHAIFTVPSLGRSGSLAMIWKEDVDLHVQTCSQNHIDAIVFSNMGPPWRITGFYGQPEENRDMKLGVCCGTFTPGTQCFGYVLGTTMKSYHQMRDKVDYQRHTPSCKLSVVHCFTVI